MQLRVCKWPRHSLAILRQWLPQHAPNHGTCLNWPLQGLFLFSLISHWVVDVVTFSWLRPQAAWLLQDNSINGFLNFPGLSGVTMWVKQFDVRHDMNGYMSKCWDCVFSRYIIRPIPPHHHGGPVTPITRPCLGLLSRGLRSSSHQLLVLLSLPLDWPVWLLLSTSGTLQSQQNNYP